MTDSNWRTECPGCHRHYSFTSQDAGQQFICQDCGAWVTLPIHPPAPTAPGPASPNSLTPTAKATTIASGLLWASGITAIFGVFGLMIAQTNGSPADTWVTVIVASALSCATWALIYQVILLLEEIRKAINSNQQDHGQPKTPQ